VNAIVFYLKIIKHLKVKCYSAKRLVELFRHITGVWNFLRHSVVYWLHTDWSTYQADWLLPKVGVHWRAFIV